MERDLYIRNSHGLRARLAQVVVEQPVGIPWWARWLGKTPPPNTGILAEEKYLYQTVQVHFGDNDQVQSADIITRYFKGDTFKKAPDVDLQFTPDGVVITESLAGRDVFLGNPTINWQAKIDVNGVEAEISSTNVIQDWNDWNRLTARSWHKREVIINEDADARLAVKTRYSSDGDLTVCSLHLGNSQPVDLLPFFSSDAMLKLQEEKGTEPGVSGINWAWLMGREIPQKEIDPPIIKPVGSCLILAIYLGIIQNSEKFPLSTAFEYTLRFHPYTADGGYDLVYHPRVFKDIGIAPNLHPSLPEIARQGYLNVARLLPGYRLEPPFQVSELEPFLAGSRSSVI